MDNTCARRCGWWLQSGRRHLQQCSKSAGHLHDIWMYFFHVVWHKIYIVFLCILKSLNIFKFLFCFKSLFYCTLSDYLSKCLFIDLWCQWTKWPIRFVRATRTTCEGVHVRIISTLTGVEHLRWPLYNARAWRDRQRCSRHIDELCWVWHIRQVHIFSIQFNSVLADVVALKILHFLHLNYYF